MKLPHSSLLNVWPYLVVYAQYYARDYWGNLWMLLPLPTLSVVYYILIDLLSPWNGPFMLHHAQGGARGDVEDFWKMTLQMTRFGASFVSYLTHYATNKKCPEGRESQILPRKELPVFLSFCSPASPRHVSVSHSPFNRPSHSNLIFSTCFQKWWF